MAKTIIKASGESEEFRIEKLVDSLVRSGAQSDAAYDIARKVEKQITPFSHTNHIFRLAKRLLKQYNHASGMRYTLKRAISALGPSGYPFEKYFARILAYYGYSVELNRIIDGYCVKHEVDILASKGKEKSVIECKYHIDSGKPADIKVALYIHSRFQDIRKAYESNKGGEIIKQGWLVTNTRCTTDAIKYAECMGLKIVSWRYPEKEGLESMIEDKKLYPVTILSSARKSSLNALFSNDIILAQEIAEMDEETFKKRSGIDEDTARALKKEADKLCLCI